jgi:hypothetical protein
VAALALVLMLKPSASAGALAMTAAVNCSASAVGDGALVVRSMHEALNRRRTTAD